MTEPIEIPLSKGYVAIIDPEDCANIAQFRWYAAPNHNTIYAQRGVLIDGRWTTETMHRRILRPGPSFVDHIDGDGLNNRRSNLRLASNHQNQRNRRAKNADNTTGYMGVEYWPSRRKWSARIRVMGKSVWLGFHPSAEAAARAYDDAARAVGGEFAGYLNFPEREMA